MVYRLILPDWLKQKPEWDRTELPPVLEGEFTEEEVKCHNELGYNAYFLPNYPANFNRDKNVDGTDIDTFVCAFVDLDMKDYQSSNADRRHDYETKQAFIDRLVAFKLPPSRIVDSGNGIHGYWYISDLTDMDFLRLQRRLCRHFKTDPAVSKLYQLMRVPGTINWKNPDDLKMSELLLDEPTEYTAEELAKSLPRISDTDEAYCVAHYNKTHGLNEKLDVDDELPAAWFKLAKKGTEAHDKFYGQPKDRSIADYRLGHIMRAANFTKEEAMAVIMNTAKASDRTGIHRYNYAEGVISKVWAHVQEQIESEKPKTGRIRSVADLLKHNPDEDAQQGARLECEPYFDGTDRGMRRRQVIGLIAGSGVGKTTFGFNMFKGFTKRNPEVIFVAVTLEQPELEYSHAWSRLCAGNLDLINRLYVLGNYNEDGTYRHLSLPEIEDEIKETERVTGKKVGAVMIDHIGVLKKESRNGENQGLIDICQYMKAFAVNTDTLLIMQSQAPREKASIGDIELDKDAAYGTVFFESFCDFVITLWQPLKRLYDQRPDLTVTIYKFCKVRFQNILRDRLKQDQRYALILDPGTGQMRTLSPDEMKSLAFESARAAKLRARDKKTEPGRISVTDLGAKP